MMGDGFEIFSGKKFTRALHVKGPKIHVPRRSQLHGGLKINTTFSCAKSEGLARRRQDKYNIFREVTRYLTKERCE